MDLKEQIYQEKTRVNGLIQGLMDSSRLETISPKSEYLIKSWPDNRGKPIGGNLSIYDYDTPPFNDRSFIQTSVLDSFEIVDIIPVIDKTGELHSFKYYGYWSPFWFLEGGWQVNHAAAFSKINSVPGGLEFIGTGDHKGQYDLILSSIEVEINDRDADMVKEWNDFKERNQKRLMVARQQVREEFVESIIRKGWIK
jgi:hypothetical protein